MSEEKTTRVFIGDSLSTPHLTKALTGTVLEKGLSTQHLTTQLKVPVQSQPSAEAAPTAAPSPTAPVTDKG